MAPHVMPVMTPKGGVSKTLLTCNLGAAFSELGRNVLLIDLDPQGDLSASLGFDESEEIPRIEQFLRGGIDAREHAQVVTPVTASGNPYPGELLLLPADRFLAESAQYLRHRDFVPVSTLIEDHFDDVDIVLIDTPAGVSTFGQAAIVAADGVLVPLYPGAHEFRSLARFIGELDRLAEENIQITLEGVVLVNIDSRTRSYKDYRNDLAELDLPQYDQTIRRHQPVTDHARRGKSTFEMYPDLGFTEDHRRLAREILTRAGLNAGARS